MRTQFFVIVKYKKEDGIGIACEKAENNRLVKKMLSKSKKIGIEVLLNLVSHRTVAWSFIKLCASYKYVGLLG